MARGFAAAGADVVVSSRKPEACVAVASDIERDFGRSALPAPAHVGRWDDIESLVETAYDRFGRVDVLVNNAGMSPMFESAATLSEELWDKVFAVNVKGPFRLAALVGQRMAAGDGGSIINISSGVSVRPRAEVIPYAAAKAALNNITLSLAHEFGPNVRSNGIICGTFLTDVSAHWDPEVFAARADKFALKRGGRPDEIVGTALYLASGASTFTTGALITVDGGQP